jgi:hypothetical protein
MASSKIRAALRDLRVSLGEAVSSLEEPKHELFKVHAVLKAGKNVYQKREDGKWDKLGRVERKKSRSRFKKQPK